MISFNNLLRTSIAALTLASAPQASAESPEQLYEPGPEKGEWRLEYNGQIGKTVDSPRSHSVEIFRGLSDRFAIGVEVEGEVDGTHLRVEEIGIGALLGLTDEDSPVEAAVLVQAGITTEGRLGQLETRFIVEHESGPWEALGNVNLRRVNAEEKGISLGYAVTLRRRISDHIALGVETSGQAARISGYADGFDAGHYVGPSAIVSWDVAGGREIEFGVKYLRRIDSGRDYRDTVRLAFGFAF